MKTNVILDFLPDTIVVDGKEIELFTDFRDWLQFNRLLNQKEITDEEVKEAFDCVIKKYVHVDPLNLIKGLMDFMNEKEKVEIDETKPIKMKDLMAEKEEDAEPIGQPVLDYDYDSNYIYAAFLQQYGIDLRNAEMHWYEFKALFSGLTEKCKIVEIIGYRSISDSSYSQMSKEERKRVKRMQKIYQLPDKRSDEEIERDFANGL